MSVYTTHKPGGDDTLYLKLKDGDSVKLRISSDCAVQTYDGKKLRYSWVVWNRELKKAQVYSAGVSVYSQIADLVEDWGEPTQFDVRIKRVGAGMLDTNYSVSPVKESMDLVKTEEDEVKKVDLLKSLGKSKWLADYIEDGEMPEVIETNNAPTGNDEVAPMPEDNNEEINLGDIPF